MRTLVAFIVGVVFGVGLIRAGMTDPTKVTGFLDLAGPWDPSLALVMGGAMAVASLGFAFARRRGGALLGGALQLPTSLRPDPRLVLGSLAFGIGWGLAGLCPGPALVVAASGNVEGMIFLTAMVLGMGLYEYVLNPSARKPPQRMRLPDITHLTRDFATGPQLSPEDLAGVAAAGFRSVINNRPDGEGGAGQPTSATLASAAARAGLRYVHMPVAMSEVDDAAAVRFAALLAELPKPVLAFCARGSRSHRLFQLSEGR